MEVLYCQTCRSEIEVKHTQYGAFVVLCPTCQRAERLAGEEEGAEMVEEFISSLEPNKSQEEGVRFVITEVEYFLDEELERE